MSSVHFEPRDGPGPEDSRVRRLRRSLLAVLALACVVLLASCATEGLRGSQRPRRASAAHAPAGADSGPLALSTDNPTGSAPVPVKPATGGGSPTPDACLGDRTFLIGSGVYDITGPAAQVGMMGYSRVEQKTSGIHLRLRSRAFVIASPCNGRRVVFVSVDLQSLPQGVQQEVVDRLRKLYGHLYRDENVLLSATHTHSVPGGLSRYVQYDLSILGFNRQNFEAVVDGIVKSIVKAHRSLVPGTIRVASGELLRASINRQPVAYRENVGAQTDLGEGLAIGAGFTRGEAGGTNDMIGRPTPTDDTNKTMTVLRLESATGDSIGMISWFAVHATSMGPDNQLISGDNKGYASYRFEKLMGTRYDAARTFVAAFAQSDEGDVSPNVCSQEIFGAPPVEERSPRDVASEDCRPGKEDDGIHGWDDGGGSDDFESTRISGERQFRKALELYRGATELLTGGVDYRHAYVRMNGVSLSPDPAGHPRGTCRAAIGLAVLGGAPDGWGPRAQARHGEACRRRPDGTFTSPCFSAHEWDCQGPKPYSLESLLTRALLWSSRWGGFPLAPQTLPLQIVRIGDLAVVAVPFEVTTTSGRRLRATVLEALRHVGVSRAVIAGLSNAYAGYLATREEYRLQLYEGASTLFGQWTLDVLRQELVRLAEVMRRGEQVEPGPRPRPPSRLQIDLQTGVIKDDVPRDVQFGDVFRKADSSYDADSSYTVGDTVRVTFWGAHPRNDLRIQDTFLKVQRKAGSSWVTVANDWDWETRFIWRRSRCLSCSLVTVVWTIPPDAVPGIYRIRHYGDWKSLFGRAHPYVGTSREFAVRPPR